MLDTFISLLEAIPKINLNINLSYNRVSNVHTIKDNTQIESIEKNSNGGIERLSNDILYAPNMVAVRDITQNRQRKINDFREVKESLEPVQRVLGSEILSSAIILTPDKMQTAMQASPWEVLLDILPVSLSNPPNNPDMIPIVFQHEGMQYVGWQMRGTLPILFDCEYHELLVPETQIQTLSNKRKPGDIFRDRLKDNSEGPQMVLIPAGTFRMGDITGNGNDDEQPVHEVSLESFAMGRYPVTVAEFKQFVNATGYKTEAEKADGAYVWKDDDWKMRKDANWRNPYFSQTDNHPVVCVSWNDAVAYTEWLSEQTEQQYCLSTEAEWEYAARAGTETDYWWGNDIYETKANYNKNLGHTSSVGDYEPNPFGLYDTAGNVWEWTCSEYEDKYNGKEKVCISANSNEYRVLRGCSWSNEPGFVRSAGRVWDSPIYRYGSSGFRVVVHAAWIN